MRCLRGLSLLNFGNPPPLITYAELFCQIPLQYVIDQEGAILSAEMASVDDSVSNRDMLKLAVGFSKCFGGSVHRYAR